MNNSPIGIFDSGMGGLSIWQQIATDLPSESLIFFGDGLRCPYGTKSQEQILEYTVDSVARLLAEGCKMVVIACNTATAVAIEHLRTIYPHIPFVGLEPAVKPAALTTKSGTVAVLATARALEGELFKHTSAQYADSVNIITAVGEGFVEIVESGMECSAEAEEAVRRVVEPLIEAGADKIVLGCTHYPFLRQTIEHVIGERDVEVIDSGSAVCRRVAQLLDEHNLRADEQNEPLYEFMTLADDDYLNSLILRAYGCDSEEEA